MDNRFNKVFFSFDPFKKQFVLGYCLIDIFSSHFSFHILSKSDKCLNMYIQALDNIALTFSSDPSIALVVADASIKNQVAISISYIHVHNKQVIKIIYHTVNVTITEAKLFAIRYSINQATNLQGIRKIVVITNFIHSARKFLTILCISFKFIWYQSLMNLGDFSTPKTVIPSNSGNVGVIGFFTKLLTKTKKYQPILSFL